MIGQVKGDNLGAFLDTFHKISEEIWKQKRVSFRTLIKSWEKHTEDGLIWLDISAHSFYQQRATPITNNANPSGCVGPWGRKKK